MKNIRTNNEINEVSAVGKALDFCKSIFDNLHEPILILDSSLKIQYANKAYYKSFRVERLETEGAFFHQISDGQWNIPKLRTLLEDILPNRTSFADFEVTLTFQHIGERVMRLNTNEITLLNQEDRLIQLAIRDVTENVTFTRKVEESNSRYYSMLMRSPFAFSIMKGKDMRITLANNLIKEIWGKGDHVEGKTLLEVLPELEDQPFPQMMQQVYTTGEPSSANEILAQFDYNGELTDRYFNVIYYPHYEPDESISGVVTIATEVTKQVLARKDIEANEHRYRNMIYTSPSLIAILKGKEMVIEIANDAILESWGKGKDIVGKSLLEVMPELVAQGFGKQLDNVYQTGKPFYAYETPASIIMNGKHQLMHYTFLYQAQRDINGEIEGVAILANEVTPQVEAKNKLIESERRLRNLVDQAPTPIMILKGEDMVMEVANGPVLKIFNVGEDALGKPFLEILPEMEDQPFIGWLREVFYNGTTHYGNEEPAYFNREGGKTETVYFNFTYQPYREDNDNIIGVMVLANDVTGQVLARKKIEESEAHFRHMADLMPAKVSNAKGNGEVTYFNQQWLDFSGLTFQELKDFGYHKMIHPDEILEFQSRLQQAAETKTGLEMEMRFMNKEGEYKWHLNLASPVFDEQGKITMWIGSTTDIQKLKEEEQRKKDFVSMLSHELKTPVTSIKGYVQILQKIIGDEQNVNYPAQLKSSLLRIDTLVSKLTSLIYEMLDLTRIEANGLELKKEPVSINELVTGVVEDIQNTSPRHTINVSHDFNCVVNMDKDKIGQVLSNFVGNAIKYAPNNYIIDITIYQAETGHVAVSVRDYGIGIDKKEHKKIFERFYRVEGKTEQTFSGFGIGLFIVKSIIEKHDGTIIVESEKGKGSVFTFILPIAL